MKIYDKHNKYLNWSGDINLALADPDVIEWNLITVNGFKFRIICSFLVNGLFNPGRTDYYSTDTENSKQFFDLGDNFDGLWTYIWDQEKHNSCFYFQNKEDTLKFILKFGCKEVKDL